MTLLLMALALLLAGTLAGALWPARRWAEALAIAALLLLFGELARLVVPASLPLWGLGPFQLALRLDALSRVSLVMAALSVPALLFAASERGVSRLERLSLPLLLAGVLLTIAAGTAETFLAGWELMGLAAYLMTGHRDGQSAAKMAGFLEVGVGALFAAFLLLGHANFAALEAAPQANALVLALVLIGFGAKLGALPLTGWVSDAYQATRSSGTVLYSGAMWIAAVYGLLRFCTSFLKVGVAGGTVLLVLGALTATYAAFRSLAEPELRRLLAFSTVENGGIVWMALGAGLTFQAAGELRLGDLGLLLALYLSLHHLLDKGLALQAAGAAEQATGIRSLDWMGGLARRLPWSTAGAFAGLLSLGALPPFSGFVGEWLLFQLLFQSYHLPGVTVRLVWLLSAAAFALLSAAALVAATKALGTGFLGAPRSEAAARAAPEPGLTRWSAALGIALSVAAAALPWSVFPVLDRALGDGVRLARLVARANWQVNPAYASVAAISPAALWVFLPAVTLLFWGLLARRRRRIVPVWVAASAEQHGRIQVSGTGYTNSLRQVFAALYRPLWGLDQGHYLAEIRDWLDQLYRAVGSIPTLLIRLAARIQAGYVTLYTLYILAALLVGLAWAVVVYGH